MNNWLYFYQHIPGHLSPTAVSFGPISIGWYSLMYLAGFLAVYLLLRYRIKKKEGRVKISLVTNFLIYAFIGLIVGARLGYVFFYNFPYYRDNLLAVISPFDPNTGEFTGIYGLSYHGGLIGIIAASLIFSRRNRIDFWPLANFAVPAIPAGYFFGRIGNFLNGELYGRPTDSILGMYFPADNLGLSRHPSQLYEATLEGLILFLISWKIRNSEKFKNKLVGLYVLGYASVRIISEFFREPDEQIGFIFKILTLGQILSLIMLISGIVLVLYPKNQKDATILEK